METPIYQPSYHIGQVVYTISNKTDSTGRTIMNVFEIRCGIITEMTVKMDYMRKSNKTWDGQKWSGAPDEYFIKPDSSVTREFYQTTCHFQILDKNRIYPSREAARDAICELTRGMHGITIEDLTEDITVQVLTRTVNHR